MLAENLSHALDVFKTKAPTLVGVDIASTSIKMVELSEAGKGTYRLERYAIEPLAKDVVQDGNIANLDQVADALRRGFKRLGSRNRNVALALPARRRRSSSLPSRPRRTSTYPSRSTRSTSTSRSSGRRPTTRTRSRS